MRSFDLSTPTAIDQFQASDGASFAVSPQYDIAKHSVAYDTRSKNRCALTNLLKLEWSLVFGESIVRNSNINSRKQGLRLFEAAANDTCKVDWRKRPYG